MDDEIFVSPRKRIVAVDDSNVVLKTIKNVLIALEDEFDEDLAIKLLKEGWR